LFQDNKRKDLSGINNVDITLFNWDEIYKKSRKDLAAIIILAYAQTKLYNEISSKGLMKKLNIHHIPPFLFYTQTLTQHKHMLICNYTTEEPQSYFKNPAFLTSGASAKHKVIYLRALSMRRLTETCDYIPRDYLGSLSYNPFLQVDNDFIYFPQENSNRIS